MLTVEDALAEVRAHAKVLPAEPTALRDAAGLVLAEEIVADRDSPPFDKALVDGYAVRSADWNAVDFKGELRVVEEIPAGRTPTHALRPGECASIMTGAPLPVGADAVMMIERTERHGDSVCVMPGETLKPGQGRLARGREMQAGEVILRPGTHLHPAQLGLLASVGRAEVLAVPRPRIVIVPTGDELVEPNQVPGPGQIRNSNATILRTLAQAYGASTHVTPIARDEPAHLADCLESGLLTADIMLVTGGVSAGKRDLVPGALDSLGVQAVFHKVRIRPGKPLLFGVGPARSRSRPQTLVFGLPGNPVSGIVGFLLFVRPALEILAGLSNGVDRATRRGVLAKSYRHQGDRPTYQPARWVEYRPDGPRLEPVEWAGSADLRAVALADGFAVFGAGERTYQAGETVPFLPLRPASPEIFLADVCQTAY